MCVGVWVGDWGVCVCVCVCVCMYEYVYYIMCIFYILVFHIASVIQCSLSLICTNFMLFR